uniref:Cytochrom P450 n=1 Tax=Phlebia brevispora TaxID=194682 RepID=G5ELB2_9APHY|nr:cytochrom P450 [Phlebia brevispora]
MALIPFTLSLVLEQFAKLIYPGVLLSVALIVLDRASVVHVPGWAIAVIVLTGIIPYHIAAARYRLWRDARKAASLGAILPPRWEGKAIGSRDLLKMLDHAWQHGYLSDQLWEKFSELGSTYDLYIFWAHDYCTTDVNIVKSVLATEFDNWVKGKGFDSFMRSVLGTGVFNADGDLWKFHRSMTRPFFSRERIHHYEVFDRHAEEAISKMKDRLREGYAVNFADAISRFTLDTATEFLFNKCVHSLRDSTLPYPHNAPPMLHDLPLSAADQFARAFMDAQGAISARARTGWVWPWFEIFRSKTAAPMRVVDAFVAPILKQALERAKIAKESGLVGGSKADEIKDDECLLDHLVRHTTDPVILHDEVLNIMLAGRDTTAGMMTVTVYFLSQYPNVLKRLREEILEKVGPINRPTYDDIREMKYLRAVLNESMRLYPAVPWNMRYAVQDALLPNSEPNGKPFYIPAGASVSYSVHCMHRRKDYWGPDAEEFDPDRFLDHRLHKYLTPNPFIFLPFNAGPRICLGQQFAYNEMSFFIVRLLQNFETISLDIDAQPPDTRPPAEWAGAPGRKGVEKFWPKAHLTVYADGGLWVKFKEVSSDI